MTRLERFAERLTREMVETRERVARAGMVDLATYDASDDGQRYQEGNAAARLVAERMVRQFVRETLDQGGTESSLDEPENP